MLRFAIALAALALLWLAMFLGGGEGSLPDLFILSLFYAGDSPAFADIAAIATEFGGWRLLTLLGIVFTLALVWKGEYRRALVFAFVALAGRALVELQKDWSARNRPEEEHLVDVTSLSFPSGHTANSTITYIAIALLLAPLVGKRWRAVLFAAAAFVPLAVGVTRMMLGVHWPSDVVGGWAFGLFWTLLLLRLTGFWGTRPAPPSLTDPKEKIDEQRE